MKFKKFFPCLIILCFFIICIGQVSAADISNETHSFTDLEYEINQTSDNAVLDLKYDYYKNNGSESGIIVNKSITINGLSTIDANGVSQIFNFKPGISITLNDITFINGNSTKGGAIFSNSANLNLNNCTFSNNNASSGGSLFVQGVTTKIINCTFNDNVAQDGGAIYSDNNLNIIETSKFINNYASNYGGAIYTTWKARLNITNTSFTSNKAKIGAGAICSHFAENNITDSIFVNNSVVNDNGGATGGAIIFGDAIVSLNNTKFINNSVVGKSASAGALLTSGYFTLNVYNCEFIGNVANGDYGVGSSILNKGIINFYNSLIKDNVLNTKNKVTESVYTINGKVYYDNLTIVENNSYTGSEDIIIGLYSPYIYNNDVLDNDDIVLPAYFDLRNVTLENGTQVSYITSIKNQGSAGTCWAFSAISALESALLYQNGTYYDLSENNMKNSITKYNEYGWDYDPNHGGNREMVLAYLLSWRGPVSESDDPYNDTSIISPSNLTTLFHIQNVYLLPVRMNLTDLTEMKLALMKYGSITVDYYYPDHNTNTYTNYPLFSSHGVSIVGWDDNYSASNFAITPPGDGAFIIKNSHGTSIGENGYHYISYYDKSLRCAWQDGMLTFAYINVEDVNNYAENYQYDMLGNTLISLGFNNETGWMMNQFTANNSRPLAAFGLYTYSPNSSYEAYVYVNDELVHTQSGTIDLAGYNTIKFTDLVPVSKGDVFKVAIKLTTPNLLSPIAIETQTQFTSKAESSENQSFISKDGVNWYDISKNTTILNIVEDIKGSYNYFRQYVSLENLSNTNVCLKVYTAGVDPVLSVSNVTMYYKNGSAIEAKLTIEDKPLVNQTVTISVNGINYDLITDDNGIVKLLIGLNAGYYNVSTYYDGGYGSTSFNSTLTVLHTIKGENVTVYYRNGSGYYVHVTDGQGNPLIGVNVTMNINGVYYYRETNVNGGAFLPIGLNAGTYIVTAENPFNGEKTSNIVTVLPILIGEDVTVYHRNGSGYSVKALDSQGNPAKSVNVRMNINGVFYNVLTDDGGYAFLPIGLNPGDYIITAEYNGFMTSNKITVLPVLTGNDITLYYRDGTSYKVMLVDGQGNPLADTNVTMNINGVFYYRTTNTDGVADLPIGLLPGKYIITTTYHDHATSNKITVIARD